MGDRKIFANMGYEALWQEMQPRVQEVAGAYASGEQMMQRFADAVTHARHLIKQTCDRCGVAPHNCVCAVYCFMCQSGFYSHPLYQAMLAAMVKAEMEIMAEESRRAQDGRQAQGNGQAQPARHSVLVVRAPGHSVVVNNHHNAGDTERLKELERKVNQLLKVVGKDADAEAINRILGL